MKAAIWMILYIVSWGLHATWIIWAQWIVKRGLNIKNTIWQYVIACGAWVAIVIICNGCPFTYIHQWIELKAGWRESVTYKYQDSVVYKYIVRPVSQVTYNFGNP